MKNRIAIISVLILSVLFFVSCNKNNNNYNDVYQTSQLSQSTEDTPSATPDISALKFRTSFIGCGDNIIYGTKEALIHAEPGGRKYNYKPYYRGVSDIVLNADIAFINQETLMCGEGYQLSYYPMFNSPQELGYDIVELGFDIVNIANNHMLDKGADGLSKTIGFWKNMDVLMIGGYEDESDFDNIRIYEKDGMKIALLSYTYATNGLSKPATSKLKIPYINDNDIIRQTALAKNCSDFIMVSVHWGDEGSLTPNSEQKRVAQLFADCGVDAVIGHHPHVIQPVEWMTGKDGNKMLCVYSLGNFMAQQDRDYNMVGGIISFDIVHSQKTKPYIENVQYIPTVFHFNGRFTDNNVYRMQDYTPELANVHGVKTYFHNKLTYEGLLKYVTDTIDAEFLPEYFHEQ